MARSVLSRFRAAGIAVSLCLFLSSPLLAQRSDRATISGVVTDEQGNAVPGATVTIHNDGTGVNSVLVTNTAGAYTSPPLVLGRYTVTVDLTGFKKAISSDIVLGGGDAIRRDVTLQVGQLTESVEVKSTSGLDDTKPDVSHTVDERYYRDLPTVLPRPAYHHGRRRPACGVRAADAARLSADEAQRRSDVPRQPVQLPDQRRPDDGLGKLLRRRRLRISVRPPAEP